MGRRTPSSTAGVRRPAPTAAPRWAGEGGRRVCVSRVGNRRIRSGWSERSVPVPQESQKCFRRTDLLWNRQNWAGRVKPFSGPHSYRGCFRSVPKYLARVWLNSSLRGARLRSHASPAGSTFRTCRTPFSNSGMTSAPPASRGADRLSDAPDPAGSGDTGLHPPGFGAVCDHADCVEKQALVEATAMR